MNGKNGAMHYDDSLDDEPISVEGITFFYPGNFKPVTQSWQKEKRKFLQMTYTKGVLYENEAIEKSLEIRQLIPSRENRISPDGNGLFRSLSYVIAGTDSYHQQIRGLLIQKMKGEYRETCSKYCNARNDLLPEARCNTIEEYLKISLMDRLGSWGTDLEIFLAAQILGTDIFVYKDESKC